MSGDFFFGVFLFLLLALFRCRLKGRLPRVKHSDAISLRRAISD